MYCVQTCVSLILLSPTPDVPQASSQIRATGAFASGYSQNCALWHFLIGHSLVPEMLVGASDVPVVISKQAASIGLTGMFCDTCLLGTTRFDDS